MSTCTETVWAEVANICIITPLIEEAADLVNPASAHVTLHPCLFLLTVIFALLDVHFLDALAVQFHDLPLLVNEAVVAPIALQILCRSC